MTKIIPLFPIPKAAALPLTPLMIKTLRAACKMQKNSKVFGQADLNGSFMALLNREYIDCKAYKFDGKEEVSWFVTRSGIKALSNLGFKNIC